VKTFLAPLFVFFLVAGIGSQASFALQDRQSPTTLPAPAQISPTVGVFQPGLAPFVNFQWAAVPGASAYGIEIDCPGCCVRPGRCYTVRDLETPGFSYFGGYPGGRWRVWAESPLGDGNMSEWRDFSFRKRDDIEPSLALDYKRSSSKDCEWRTAQEFRWDPARTPAYLINSPMPYSGGQKVNEVISFEVKVEADGQISDVCFMGPVRNDLYEAIMSALKRWRFRPARKDNTVVPSIMHYEIRFRACCEQAVLFYPPMPALTEAQAQNISKTVSQSPCPFYPSPMSGATFPRAIYHPDPDYTSAALKSKVTGSVGLMVNIGSDGWVKDVCVARSLRPDLDESAMTTIKTWRFEPAQKNGVAVAAVTFVEVSFNLQ